MQGCRIVFCIQRQKMCIHINKYHVSITSHLCFSKMGLCLFFLTLALLLGILNWIFRRCSAEMVVLSLSVIVLFPECLKFSTTSLLAAAVWYPYEAAQFILNLWRTGSVAVQWEGPYTGKALPGSAGRWDINVCVHLETLKCLAWLLCVAKAKVLKGRKSQLCQFNGWDFSVANRSFPEVLMFLLLLCRLCLIHSGHLLHSGDSF